MLALSVPPSWQDVDAYHTSEAVSQAERPVDWIARRPLLDKPSEPHPILSMLMDEALRQIGLTADGAAMQLKVRTTGTKDPNAPRSGLAAELDELGSRFAGCKTHRQRLEVIKHAQAMSVRLRYAPDRSKVKGTPEWREAVAYDPRDTQTIALDRGLTVRMVQRIRKEFGTNRPRGGDQTTRVATRNQTT